MYRTAETKEEISHVESFSVQVLTPKPPQLPPNVLEQEDVTNWLWKIRMVMECVVDMETDHSKGITMHLQYQMWMLCLTMDLNLNLKSLEIARVGIMIILTIYVMSIKMISILIYFKSYSHVFEFIVLFSLLFHKCSRTTNQSYFT